ncbi:DNA helicase [Salmonella phage 19]|nr:DNA helicase [Salmonella phage 19]
MNISLKVIAVVGEDNKPVMLTVERCMGNLCLVIVLKYLTDKSWTGQTR